MNTDFDEQKLTAYALGELDPADRPTVEALLASDESARRHVEEIGATARALADELSRESDVGLGAIQYAAIERRLAEQGEHPALPPARWNRLMWGSLAASVIIVCTVMATVLPMVYRLGTGGAGSTVRSRPDHANDLPPIIVPAPDARSNDGNRGVPATQPPPAYVLRCDVSGRDPGAFHDLNVDLLTHLGQEIDLDLTVSSRDVRREGGIVWVQSSYYVTPNELRGIELRAPASAIKNESVDSIRVAGHFRLSDVMSHRQGIISLHLSPR